MARYERICGELVPVYDADGKEALNVFANIQKRHNLPAVIVDNATLLGKKHRVVMIRGDFIDNGGAGTSARL